MCPDSDTPGGYCHTQADELTAHSEKRMKELQKEIQDCERAMVRLCYISPFTALFNGLL